MGIIKRKIKWLNVILFIGFVISFILLAVAVINILNWNNDNHKIKAISNKILETTPIYEIENNQTEIVESIQDIPTENPYWKYIKMNLIHVDFSELKKKNNDTKGWIQINGTNVNYPFVQAKDNKFYLKHSFDKSYNSAGWVFLDYRNDIQNLDKNTILYAHGRLDQTLFGSLRNIFTNGWLNDMNNHVIKLSTEYDDTLWQVFSVYRIPTTNDYIQVKFENDTEFLEFGNMLKDRSKYHFNTQVEEQDYILTLSTCYNDNEKVVLHAKLIKKSTKTKQDS